MPHRAGPASNTGTAGGGRVVLAEPRSFCAGVDRAIEGQPPKVLITQLVDLLTEHGYWDVEAFAPPAAVRNIRTARPGTRPDELGGMTNDVADG